MYTPEINIHADVEIPDELALDFPTIEGTLFLYYTTLLIVFYRDM